MPAPSNALTVRLDTRETAMLRQLTKAYGGTKTDVMRELIRDAYENKLKQLTSQAGFGFTFLSPQPGTRRAVPRPPPRSSKAKPPRKPKAKARRKPPPKPARTRKKR